MSMRSDNLIHQDALWRAYVNADPELHELEHRKQRIAHRRIWEAKRREEYQQARLAVIQTLAELALKVALCALAVAALTLLICLA